MNYQIFFILKYLKNKNRYINASFGFGKVNGTGKIDTSLLIQKYKEYLHKDNRCVNEMFDYDQLQLKENHISYKKYNSKKIIFSEGYTAINNPFFPQEIINKKNSSEKLIIPNKGEYVIIKAPELKLNSMLKTSLFIIPLENDLYKSWCYL